MRNLLFSGLLLLVMAVMSTHANAATINVVYTPDIDCGDGVCDFASALTFAADNDEADVLVLPSTTALPDGRLKGLTPFEYVSTKPHGITIRGESGAKVAISGEGLRRVLSIYTRNSSGPVDLTISNVSFLDGNSNLHGGGLRVSMSTGSVLIEDSLFAENNADGLGGGALVTVAGSATVRNSVFHGNVGGDGGGLHINARELTLEENTFSNNTACSGGGVFATSTMGPVAIADNVVQSNQAADKSTICNGGGMYLSSVGFFETVLERNRFQFNQVDEGGAGGGAYINRVDGELIMERNAFLENVIGGASEDVGGGGLWLRLFGSFSFNRLINNVFYGNRAPLVGTAAQIFSLDTPVEIYSTTVTRNRSGLWDDGMAGVHVDAPTVNVMNSVFTFNPYFDQEGFDLLVLDNLVNVVNLEYNYLPDYDIPDPLGLPGTRDNFITDPPLLDAYYHIASVDSSLVDEGSTIDSLGGTIPISGVDIDDEPRVVDGDVQDGAKIDIGADELGGLVSLIPESDHFNSYEAALTGTVSSDSRTSRIRNTGLSDLQITSVGLEGTSFPEDWTIISPSVAGTSLSPGDVANVTVRYEGQSRELSSTTNLVVNTSANTASAFLRGSFFGKAHSDTDGVPDLGERGPVEFIGAYDGNCDGIPDDEQNNVTTLMTTTGDWITIVAPQEYQKIGTGDFFDPGKIPFLLDVRAVHAPDEGGGPFRIESIPYGFISFRVTTNTALAGVFGGQFPVSIILPMDANLPTGYMKNGPIPEEGWTSGRPEGGFGSYNFTQSNTSHSLLFRSNVGAAIDEAVLGDFPTWLDQFGHVADPDDPEPGQELHLECHPSVRHVIHLRLRDGLLGDHDLTEDGIVNDPGGPVILPVVETPVAVAQASPNPTVAGLPVELDGAASSATAPNALVVSWEWDLGCDGSFELAGEVVNVPAGFTQDTCVRLMVTDSQSPPQTDTTEITVDVVAAPLAPVADANGPYQFCPQEEPWTLDGTGSVNPDEGVSETPGLPGNTIIEYAWDLDLDGSFDDAFGAQPDVTGVFTAIGAGNYAVQLRTTDNSSVSHPVTSGGSDLSDDSMPVSVQVLSAMDPACFDCISDLAARPKSGKIQLTWTDTGAASYNVYRSTVSGGPYSLLANTTSTYSTYLDTSVANGVTYYYVVREVSSSTDEICQSNETSATPQARSRAR